MTLIDAESLRTAIIDDYLYVKKGETEPMTTEAMRELWSRSPNYFDEVDFETQEMGLNILSLVDQYAEDARRGLAL